jgi:hypothetical protein
LKEVAVPADHEGLKEVDGNNALITGDPLGILGKQLRPQATLILNIIILFTFKLCYKNIIINSITILSKGRMEDHKKEQLQILFFIFQVQFHDTYGGHVIDISTCTPYVL